MLAADIGCERHYWRELMLRNKKSILNMLEGMFILLPIAFYLYLFFQKEITGMSLEGLLTQNFGNAIYFILATSFFFCAYLIKQSKEKLASNQQNMAIAILIILLISQLMVINVPCVLMIIYFLYFIFKEQKVKFRFVDIEFKQDIMTWLIAAFVLFISLLICVLKIRQNIL